MPKDPKWKTRMKDFAARILIFAILLSVGLGEIQAAAAAPATDQSYALATTLKVGGDGGWDDVTLNAAGQLLYVTRTTHTMVIDVSTAKTVHDIPGTSRAHGVALVP